MASRTIRLIMAKPGLDGHDLGAKYMARAFRDAGMEVIYTGLQQTPDQIVTAAIQEDVDVIACSILSGAHMGLMTKVMKKLAEKRMDDVLVLVGGAIPRSDIEPLKALGIAGVFPTASPPESAIEFIRKNVKRG
jgi:methylmalonyl-CoA mutase C-terminal domain/subunit